MLSHFPLSLGTVLIGNTLTNIFCSSLVTLVVDEILNRSTTMEGISNLISEITVFALAMIILVFCEYLPKSLAQKHGVAFLKIFGFPLFVFYTFF
jgi:CBS domain containing-hemolysin-like protein